MILGYALSDVTLRRGRSHVGDVVSAFSPAWRVRTRVRPGATVIHTGWLVPMRQVVQ
jgi:hypothetical protein